MRGREKGNSGGGSPRGGAGEFTNWPQTQQQAQQQQKRSHLEQSQNEQQQEQQQQQQLAMRQEQERRKRQRQHEQHEQPQQKSVGGLTGGWNSGVPEQQQQMAWGRPGQVVQSGQSGGQRQQQRQMWPSVRIFAVAVGIRLF